MYFQYGGYRFPNDSTKVERSAVAIAPAGIPLWEQHTWNVTCVAVQDDVSGSTAEQIAAGYAALDSAIRAAMSRRNQRASVFTDGGIEVMALPSVAAGIGGSGPTTTFKSNPVGDGTEFAGMRTISFTITATYPVVDLSRTLVSFSETLQLRGSGAPPKRIRIGMRASALQYPRVASVCTAVQSGTAVGAISRPMWAVPKPLWPGADHDSDQDVITQASGQRQGEGLTNFAVSWSYSFSRPGKPFVGVPHEFL